MKKSITLALIIGLSPFCQAQESNNDISVKFSQSFNRLNESKFGLEYRRSVSENFKVKLGTDYGKGDKSIWLGNSILFGSDSTIIYRELAAFTKSYSFYAGVDYEGIDYLSFGASLVLGTSQTLLGAYDRGARYDTEQKDWVNCIECVYDYHEAELPPVQNGSYSNWQYASAIKSTNYLFYGISLRAAIRIPIKDRFEITSGYEPSFIRSSEVNVVEYQPLEDTYSGNASAFNTFTHTATVAVRYKF